MRRGLGSAVLLAALAAGLAGCDIEASPPLPDPMVIAPHEWDHGPPWGPDQEPWVAPPVYGFDTYYDPYYAYSPYGWGWGSGFVVGAGGGFHHGRFGFGHRAGFRGGGGHHGGHGGGHGGHGGHGGGHGGGGHGGR